VSRLERLIFPGPIHYNKIENLYGEGCAVSHSKLSAKINLAKWDSLLTVDRARFYKGTRPVIVLILKPPQTFISFYLFTP
jgi:hypothetical protein